MMKILLILLLVLDITMKSEQAVVNARDYDFNYGEDNTNSTTVVCSGQEVAGAYCDNVTDCEDGSDEQNCDSYGGGDGDYYETQCDPGQVVCWNDKCANSTDLCDTQCDVTQVYCGNNTCVTGGTCDGTEDCADGSDELDCDYNPGESCNNITEFECSDGVCISIDKKCDGKEDCQYGDDELHLDCQKPTTAAPTTAAPCDEFDEFECNNGTCIEFTQTCDGINHCADGSDEQNCECESFSCDNNTLCIDMFGVCDGLDDCQDGTDESSCGSTESYTTGNVATTEAPTVERTTTEASYNTTQQQTTQPPTTETPETTQTDTIEVTTVSEVYCEYLGKNYSTGAVISTVECNATYCDSQGDIQVQILEPEYCAGVSHTISFILISVVVALSSILNA